MNSNQTIAPHKIILVVVFIAAAIMSSIFVFRMSHSQNQALSADEYSTIFTAPRDLKDFELVKSTGSPFKQTDLLNHWTLLFFGFTHCPNVCPTTMTMLSNAYPDLHKAYPNVQVVLISLDPERDSVDVLANYTKRFHADFIGASGKIQELRKLQSQLGIFSSKENGELQHTSSILLINPQGKWAGIFKSDMTPTQFTASFNKNVTRLVS